IGHAELGAGEAVGLDRAFGRAVAQAVGVPGGYPAVGQTGRRAPVVGLLVRGCVPFEQWAATGARCPAGEHATGAVGGVRMHRAPSGARFAGGDAGGLSLAVPAHTLAGQPAAAVFGCLNVHSGPPWVYARRAWLVRRFAAWS